MKVGYFVISLHPKLIDVTTFIGDYNCKVDTKGRILFPSVLKKQMQPAFQERFVVKKDIFEKCLILYPIEEWERQNKMLRKAINPYKKEHAMFMRKFFKGTAEIALDGNNRILIPKRLLDEADIGKEVVLAGQDGKIEIWSKNLYESVHVKDDEFAALAEKILGDTLNTEDD